MKILFNRLAGMAMTDTMTIIVLMAEAFTTSAARAAAALA